MKNTEAVHQLIRTLSKAEKRHFKMTASRYSKNKNNYILLFDAIDQQEEYNESKLKRKFKNQAFGQNLGKTKYLLYELLLKSLRPLYNSKNITKQIQGLLQSVEFLFSKSLYEQAYALIRKVKKQTLHFQLYPLYYEALGFEKKLITYIPQKNVAQKTSNVLEEFDRIAGLIRMEMRYRVSSEKLHFTSLTADNELWIKTLEKEIENLPIGDFQSQPTFICNLLNKEIQSLDDFAHGDINGALKHQEEIQALWIKNAHLIPVFSEDFNRTNQKHIQYLLHKPGKEDKLHEVILHLKNQQAKINNEEEREKLELQTLILEFIINLTQGNLQICTLIKLTICEKLSLLEKVISQPLQMQFYYHVSILNFLKKEFDEALEWMIKTKTIAVQNYYPRSQRFCKILELLTRYELGDYEYLECAIRNMYRSLKNEPQKNEIETLVLRSVKKLINVSHRSEVHNILENLYDCLQKMDHQTVTQDHLQTNLLFQWINKHLTQENHEQRN